ncbi:MAG: tRNA 2-thiocytidine biosynthesis protein TtcA [Clostridia bacterium]|nr:tRNA 2-thiocytidine biosynthesis protein TtcA [Clostridia bacterium]
MKKLLGCIRRADEDFGMIQDGDKIAVGVSGGKDSIALLYGMRLYQYFSKAKYEIVGITLDMGLFHPDTAELADFCAKNDIPYHVEPTEIGNIVFDIRKESNPCALCSNLKRGALHDAAIAQGCNKVALGHHFDDVLETLMMSLLFEGRFNTFSPITYMDRKQIHVIRPMVYAYEMEIMGAVKRHNLPVFKSGCPADGVTKREEMKDNVREIIKKYPDFKERVLTALRNSDNRHLW